RGTGRDAESRVEGVRSSGDRHRHRVAAHRRHSHGGQYNPHETTISTTPILGRKFEDLLTLTPGVSIVQGPDGDEITFSGQRGMYNNISLDGGDYNNGFFGEQVGGQ